MTKFTTVVDVIERGLGLELTSKIFSSNRQLNFNVRKRIANEFEKYEHENKFTVPSRTQSELFPYVHPRWKVSRDLGGPGYKSSLDGVSSQVKSMLLYYHKVAIPDGFGYLCDHYRLSKNSSPKGLDEKFDAYLKFFIELSPLIKNGTVFIVPEFPTYYPARDAVNDLKLPDWFDEIFTTEYPNRTARTCIEESLWIGKEYGFDLFLPGADVSKFFEKYMFHANQSVAETKLQEASIGSLLLAAQLPRIESLSISNIVEIRNNSDGFLEWRSSLRKILNVFYSDQISSSFDHLEFNRYAHEEFAKGRNEIEKDISKSSSLNLMKTGVRTVGVGTATALLLSPLSPSARITAAVASAGVSFIYDYISMKLDYKDKKKLESLKIHYAIFDPS